MIRYPGSKDKISKQIREFFPHNALLPLFMGKEIEYREPFFGAGAIGVDVLAKLPGRAHVWLNDRDYHLICMWKAVNDTPRELIEMIDDFKPSVEKFFLFKEEDGNKKIDPVRAGFQKLALHQTSFSGLGAMAGGPIGGREQSSEYDVGCRWNPVSLRKEIFRINRIFEKFGKRLKITCKDFSVVVRDSPSHAVVYADPPYYEKGPTLYKHSMSDADHSRLASDLRACTAQWVLSYDDHPLVRDLYQWANIHPVHMTYTMAIEKESRPKNQEVIIVPRRASGIEAA